MNLKGHFLLFMPRTLLFRNITPILVLALMKLSELFLLHSAFIQYITKFLLYFQYYNEITSIINYCNNRFSPSCVDLKIAQLKFGQPPVQHFETTIGARNQSPPPKYESRSPSVYDIFKARGDSRPC